MHLNDGVELEDVTRQLGAEGALVLEGQWTLELEGRTYDLGLMHQVAASARLADEQPAGGRSVRLVPGADDSLVQRLGPVGKVEE